MTRHNLTSDYFLGLSFCCNKNEHYTGETLHLDKKSFLTTDFSYDTQRPMARHRARRPPRSIPSSTTGPGSVLGETIVSRHKVVYLITAWLEHRTCGGTFFMISSGELGMSASWGMLARLQWNDKNDGAREQPGPTAGSGQWVFVLKDILYWPL